YANVVRRGYWPAQIAGGVTVGAKVKYPGLHALRHFYASWCINRRADGGLELPVKVIQERLGHASIVMNSDVYGHLFPRRDDGAELAAAERALLGLRDTDATRAGEKQMKSTNNWRWKGIDFRNTRRIACSRLAGCHKRFGEQARFLAGKCGNNESADHERTHRTHASAGGDGGAWAPRRSRLRRGRDLGVRSRQHALSASRQSLAAGRCAHPRLHRELPQADP